MKFKNITAAILLMTFATPAIADKQHAFSNYVFSPYQKVGVSSAKQSGQIVLDRMDGMPNIMGPKVIANTTDDARACAFEGSRSYNLKLREQKLKDDISDLMEQASNAGFIFYLNDNTSDVITVAEVQNLISERKDFSVHSNALIDPAYKSITGSDAAQEMNYQRLSHLEVLPNRIDMTFKVHNSTMNTNTIVMLQNHDNCTPQPGA